MALAEFPNADLTLLVKDDRGTPDGARAAAQEALSEGAELIVGPLFAPSVQAAGQASTDSNELIVTPEAILVRTRPGVERFCRGGHCFGAEATTLKIADLTDEQLDAITSEGMLVVEYVIGDETGGA